MERSGTRRLTNDVSSFGVLQVNFRLEVLRRPKFAFSTSDPSNDMNLSASRLEFSLMSVENQLPTFVASLDAMFAQPEYHYPIVAAQFQYRERYYGLAGAAMLEDLFFDAFSSFLRKSQPTTVFHRPPRGEKGYDYEFNGLRLSHKVSKAGPVDIAALWDATRVDVERWTFDYPIGFASSGYSSAYIYVADKDSGRQFRMRPASAIEQMIGGDRLVLVRWPTGQDIHVLHVWEFGSPGEILNLLPFGELWTEVAKEIAKGVGPNQVELLHVRGAKKVKLTSGGVLTPMKEFFRPGTYVFDQAGLINIPVSHNNRAILVPSDFVGNLMNQALMAHDFVPTTTWFSKYAGMSPPDLYVAQKTSYDLMYSATQKP